MSADPIRVAFVCVRNAGRSQMAYAFAREERADRGLGDEVELVTGGTRPADAVHPEVVDAMRERGVDLADREPRAVTAEELRDADLVVTMGCSAADVCPASWGGESRDWDLEDPHGRSLEATREIRDVIERRVGALFDELSAGGPTGSR